MTAASKALRRRLEVASIFDEVQALGTEWLGGVRLGRSRPGLTVDRYKGLRAWHASRRPAIVARNEAILAALRAGASSRQAAERFGVSVTTADRVAAAAELARRALPPEGRDDRLIRLVLGGMRVAEVARKNDLSPWAVYKVLEARGVRLAPNNGRRPPRVAA